MPTVLKNKPLRTNKVIRLDSLTTDSDYLVVWWYCGVYKNSLANSQPLALVAFRKLQNFQYLSDEIIYKRVPLTVLGQLRIGSIWQQGECWGEMRFDSSSFNVDFTQNRWCFTTFQQRINNKKSTPYPSEIHPLQFYKDKNWILEFNLSTGGKLVIPCLEFLTRCYGRSAEMRRIIATYSWGELLNSRLYAPLDEPEEPNKWKIKLRKRLVNGDALLAAHAKYDYYSRNAVKEIYAQIEANHDPDGKKPAFIQVKPWFQGPASLKVRGIWFDEGNSFLALQITGCSEPEGRPIWRGRENSSDAKLPALENEQGTAWSGAPIRELIKQPDIIDLTDAVEPDPDAISVEIEDPEFEILGTPRVIYSLRAEHAKTSAGVKVKGADAAAFSSGEMYGSGQGIGYAAIHSKQILTTDGVLQDMWNAMLFLKTKYPEKIQQVEWFTFKDGYQSNTDPNLIAFQPFSQRNNKLDSTTWKWPYMDTKTMQEIRGALLMRIVTKENPIYILEIQRRPLTKKDKHGNIVNSEESFCGLAFILPPSIKLEQWLPQVLSATRLVKGVVKELVESCPSKATAFMHSKAKGEQVPCEAAALNALRKMGVAI